MLYSGVSPDGRLVEIAELKDHPFMVGTQFIRIFYRVQTDHIPYL
jgi:CTP synthase (UTP-ammonia lyase)